MRFEPRTNGLKAREVKLKCLILLMFYTADPLQFDQQFRAVHSSCPQNAPHFGKGLSIKPVSSKQKIAVDNLPQV